MFRLSTTAQANNSQLPTDRRTPGLEEKASYIFQVKYEFEYIYCSIASYILRAGTLGRFCNCGFFIYALVNSSSAHPPPPGQ